MPLLENELARREGSAVDVRARPLRVRWNFDDLATTDQHDLRCGFAASVQAVQDPLDRRMLAEVLLAGREVVTAADLVNHFNSALTSAAAKVAARFPIAAWIEADEKRPRRDDRRSYVGGQADCFRLRSRAAFAL